MNQKFQPSSQTQDQDIKKLGELIKDIEIAMLTTHEADGSLRSRPMATQKTEFTGELWFFTSSSSPKMHEVQHDSHVNLSYASPKDQKYVSVSGRAERIKDRKKAEELWNPLYKAWFPKGLEDPELCLLKVKIEQAEYWDSPHGAVVHLIGFAKAFTTGQPYKPSAGEHGKLDHIG